MLNGLRKIVQGRRIGKLRGKSNKEVVLLRVGFIFKTSLILRRGFQIRFLMISQRTLMIEVIILHLKRGKC